MSLHEPPSFPGAHSILAAYWKAVTQSELGFLRMSEISYPTTSRTMSCVSAMQTPTGTWNSSPRYCSTFSISPEMYSLSISFPPRSDAHVCIEHKNEPQPSCSLVLEAVVGSMALGVPLTDRNGRSGLNSSCAQRVLIGKTGWPRWLGRSEQGTTGLVVSQ